MRIASIGLAALIALAILGCSSKEEEDTTPAPPPTWQSFYAACRVEGVTVASSGRIWAGTQRNGLRYFDGSGWHHFLLENSGILSNAIRDVCLDSSGRCWIATDRGICIFDGLGFTSVTRSSSGGGLPSDDVRCLLLAADDAVWVGTASGAAWYDGTWHQGFALADGMAANLVISMCQDNATTPGMWFGHSASGLTHWDGSAFTVYTSATSGLWNNTVNGIAFDSSNMGWFATNGALCSFDGTTWADYRMVNSNLPHNNVRDVFVDGNDAVWAATGAGLARLHLGSWNTYSAPNLSSDDTRCCFVCSNGTAYVGSNLGLNWMPSGGTWTGSFTGNAALSSNSVRDITVASGGWVWYATSYGVTRHLDNQWEIWAPFNSAISGADCHGVYVEADGTAWIGTFSGLNRFNAWGWAVFNTSNSSIPNNWVNDITPDPSGDLWISTWGGVSRFDGTSTWTSYTTADGLGSNIVADVAVDGAGTVWAATLGGLSRFDGTSSWTNFTTADGLPSNLVNAVAIRGSEIWVAAGVGGAASSSNGGSSWTVYSTATVNFPSNDTRSIALASNGDVYIGTAGGLAVRIGGTWTTRSTWNSGLVNDLIQSVHLSPDQKTLFIGTVGPLGQTGAGVSWYRPEHVNN